MRSTKRHSCSWKDLHHHQPSLLLCQHISLGNCCHHSLEGGRLLPGYTPLTYHYISSSSKVTAMTKEKTALVIPNAVQICTGSDKYFFTSFAARDKTHVVMFRLWQNSLLDNPALQPELWSWVQSVYGDKTER